MSVVTLFLAVKIVTRRLHSKSTKRIEQRENLNELFRCLDTLPGPNPLPLFGNIFDIVPKNRLLDETLRWTKVYGPCIKLYGPFGMKGVLLNSAENIQTILQSSDGGHTVKTSLIYNLTRPFINNGLLVSRGNYWQKQRKTLMKFMSYNSLRACIPIFNTHCLKLVESLEKHFADARVHTIGHLLHVSFLEVICHMITGFELQNVSNVSEFLKNLQIWSETIMYRAEHPWFVPSPIWRLNPLSWQNDKTVESLNKFAEERMEEHSRKTAEAKYTENENGEPHTQTKTSDKCFQSILDLLVGAGLSHKEILDEVNTMLFGGHETAAMTTHLLCFCLALNPHIQEECRKEVDSVFNDPLQTENGQLVYDSLVNLKYLERTILEVLRIYPPVWFFSRDLEAPLNIKHEGKIVELPVGIKVVISPYTVHRNEEYYPSPEIFDPDRHLPEEVAKRHAYSYIPFSMGPRNCLGHKFAIFQLKLVAAYLIRNFEISTVDRIEDVKLIPNFSVTLERDLNFVFKRRTLS